MIRSCLVVIASALVFVSSARADEIGHTGAGQVRTPMSSDLPEPKLNVNRESPQRFAFELKFGPYTPGIDDAAGVGSPYRTLFGGSKTITLPNNLPQTVLTKPKDKLLSEIEFDYQFWHKFGSLGVGINVGFFRNSAKGLRYADGVGQSCDPTGELGCSRSGDKTALNILPVALLAVYRFDYLAKRWHVPLVPYAKLGLGYAFWWVERGGGATDIASATINSKTYKGYGGTIGWTARPGLAIQLDQIDRATAKTMDVELGINHAYIFCEMNYMEYSGFGDKNRMRLSDLTYAVGLAFEM